MAHGRSDDEIVRTTHNTARFFTETRHVSWVLLVFTVAWGLYGTALIVVGIVRKYAPVRYLVIALLAMTVVKAFLLDLSMLGRIYRIIGFVGLGVFLLLGAWLDQRYRGVILGRE